MGPSGIVFDANGDLIVLSAAFGNFLKFDGVTGNLVQEFGSMRPGGLQDMVRGPNGDLYVSGQLSPENLPVIERFDGVTGISKGYLSNNRSIYGGGYAGMAFDPSGEYLYVSGDRRILRFSAATGAFFDVFADTDLFAPDGLAFTPFATVPEPASLMIWGLGFLGCIASANFRSRRCRTGELDS